MKLYKLLVPLIAYAPDSDENAGILPYGSFVRKEKGKIVCYHTGRWGWGGNVARNDLAQANGLELLAKAAE